MNNFRKRQTFVKAYVPIKSKHEHPTPPSGNPGHLTIFCVRGVGNLTFVCVRWGKLNRKCQVSNDYFFRSPKTPKPIKHVFGRNGRVKRKRDVAFVSDWLTKKVFIKDRWSQRQLFLVGYDRKIR